MIERVEGQRRVVLCCHLPVVGQYYRLLKNEIQIVIHGFGGIGWRVQQITRDGDITSRLDQAAVIFNLFFVENAALVNINIFPGADFAELTHSDI